MARYLLDTDTLIDFSKGFEPTRSRLLQLIEGGDVLGVCAINIAEFFSGVPATNRTLWLEFFASLDYWDITGAAAASAGATRYDLAVAGQPITTSDSLIAAVAVQERAVVLSSNARDFALTGVTARSLRTDGN